jgi:hypothetical protein
MARRVLFSETCSAVSAKWRHGVRLNIKINYGNSGDLLLL